jgi:hypothetical protein
MYKKEHTPWNKGKKCPQLYGKNNPNWKGGKIKRICKNCKRVFYVTNHIVKTNEGIYCSRKCSDKGRINKVKTRCIFCNKEFKIIPSYIKRGGGKYCSNKCLHRNFKLKQMGKNNTCWRGGKTMTNAGYIKIHQPGHPFAIDNYVFEHRLVMEKHLSRYLNPKEVVHHINGVKNDNRIVNLMLFANSVEHTKFHHSRA